MKISIKIMSIILSAAMALCALPCTVFADDIDDADTVYEDTELTDDDSDLSDDDSGASADEPDHSASDKDAIAGGANDEHEVTIPAKQIRLKSGSNKKLKIGESFQIKATLKPSDSDDYLTYKSNKPGVVQVTPDGYVTAVGFGEAAIQIKTSSGAKVKCYVTVSSAGVDEEVLEAAVEKIVPIDENIMLHEDSSVQLEYICYPLGSYAPVKYSSADPEIAEVSASGKVTANKAGNTEIYLETENGITGVCYITVYNKVYMGIDVSKWQGDINWKKVKNSGTDFVMIRSSFGDCDEDIKLKQNVKGCEKYDIPYGFYHYTYARNVAEAKAEAKFLLKTIKNYSPEYPIVLDIEEEFYKKMKPSEVTKIIIAFMEEIEDAGYYAMIYSYAKFFTDNVQMDKLSAYDIWVASWGDEEKLSSAYDGHYGMWQYSSTGTVPGIDGEVDLNYAFKNYRKAIISNGLNNL